MRADVASPRHGIVQNSLQAAIITDARLLECRGKSGIWRNARIRVDFQNPRLAALVAAKIDARVTGQVEQSPAFNASDR